MKPARRMPPAVLGIVIVALLAGVLQFASAQLWVSRFLLPPPTEVVSAIGRLFAQGHLLTESAVTFLMTFAAVALGLLVGAPIGWILYRFRNCGRAFGPWFTALFSAPIVLLYPMYVVIFGRSNLSMVMLGATVATIPIVLKTREGFAAVPPVLVNVGRSFNAPPLRMFTNIFIPAAAPSIFVGIRLGLIYALVNIVATGFLIDFGEMGGLGNLIATLYDRYDIPGMYAAILFVVIVSITFFKITERVELWLRPR